MMLMSSCHFCWMDYMKCVTEYAYICVCMFICARVSCVCSACICVSVGFVGLESCGCQTKHCCSGTEQQTRSGISKCKLSSTCVLMQY